MSYVRKQRGRWRAEVAKAGVRMSKVFDTKAEAVGWATQEEAAIAAAEGGRFPARTLADAFDRYEQEVSPTKRVCRPLARAQMAGMFPP